MISHFNLGGGDYDNPKHLFEGLSLINDQTAAIMQKYIAEQSRPWVYLPWNDKRTLEIKENYGLRSVPQVLVLDKNLEVITR